MQTITYRNADRALAQAMPELAAPVARCIEEYEETLQYLIFEGVFARFIETLLVMPASPKRDRLLQRAISFVGRLLQCDDANAADLGYIAIYEGRAAWWLARAMPFMGPASIAILDTCRPDWRDEVRAQALPDTEREIIDLYGARDVIAGALQTDGIGLAEIPGITAPRAWTRYPSLEEARQDANGTVFLSCFGTSSPYVICPARLVMCDESALLDLARELANIEDREPHQREKARSGCYPIALGERVWNMHDEDLRHSRYRGRLWIDATFVAQGLVPFIERVLRGEDTVT